MVFAKLVEKSEFSAVLLAAGLSSRFGGEKLKADLCGETVLERSVKAVNLLTRSANIRQFKLVLPPGASFDQLPFNLVVHAPQHANGFANSLRAGLMAVDQASEGIFVFLADMPFVPQAALLKHMIKRFKATGADAARPVWQGQAGHPVLLGRKLFGKILELQGDIGAREILKDVNCIHVPARDDSVIFDIDTKRNLIEARQRFNLSP